MSDYRRNRVPGGTFFFTVNLLDRRSDLLVTQIHMLRDAVRQVRRHAPFRIDAWVVLPTIRTACGPYPQTMPSSPVAGAIKTAFSKAFPAREPRSPAMTSRDGAASATAVGLVGSSPLARRSDRLEQPTAVADRGDAEVLEVLCRQTRQHSAIAVVVAEIPVRIVRARAATPRYPCAPV